MITDKELMELADKLKNDESFCRLVAYGENPFDENKKNIVGSEKHEELLNDIIRFSPQIHDLEDYDTPRILIFKHYSKLQVQNDVIRYENVQIDIYVPHRLMYKELRVYQLENKIANLLDRTPVGVGVLDYVEGRFVTITNITGYSQYTMVFLAENARKASPYHGRL